MAWGKAGSTTLTSAGDSISVSSLPDKIFYMGLANTLNSGSTFHNIQFNSDTGTNYAYRYNDNGGTDGTLGSNTSTLFGSPSSTTTSFSVGYIVNISGEEKLVIAHGINQSTAGAGTAPARRETVGKWANTSVAINEIDFINGSSGDYDTDSNLSVLGSDLTPVAVVPAQDNVQDNSIFVETDTASRYWFEKATPITFEDDFSSSTGWTTANTGISINTSTEEIDWNANSAVSGVTYYDLGVGIPANKWILQAEVTVDNFSHNSDGTQQTLNLGLSDSTSNMITNQEYLGVRIETSSFGDLITTKFVNGTTPFVDQQAFAESLTTTTYYVEIKRTSSTGATMSLYTDNTYTTLIEAENVTFASTLDSLRYIKFGVYENDNTSNGTLNGTMDNVKFYNGVTSVTPATWTMQPTFEDDFTTASKWTQTGSNITISNNQLTWIGDRTTSSHGLHHDMGANRVSTSKWLLDFDLILDAYSAGSATYTSRFGIMLTNVDSSVGTYGSDATRDFIGARISWRTAAPTSYREFSAVDDNGSTDTWADNVPTNTQDDGSNGVLTPSAGNTYKIRIIRLTSTTYKIEIRNSSGTLLDTLNGTCSNSSDLRYILVQSYNSNSSENPNFDGKIDNMKFYDGVTSI
jgi:hypothetical protein